MLGEVESQDILQSLQHIHEKFHDKDWLCMMMLESCDCHPSGAVICFFFIELFSQRLKLQITQIYKLLIIINYTNVMDVILM